MITRPQIRDCLVAPSGYSPITAEIAAIAVADRNRINIPLTRNSLLRTTAATMAAMITAVGMVST